MIWYNPLLRRRFDSPEFGIGGMTLTVKIEKNVYGGDGLGRLGDGRVVFVAGAYTGETVKVEIFEQKKNYVKARLVEIVDASPDRLKVPLADVVPGMVYTDVSHAAEMRYKQDQLENFLWKISHSVLPLEVVPAKKCLAYRNKAVYHIEKQNGKWVIGYRKEPEHRVVDVAEDPMVCPEINAELPKIRAGIMALLTQGAYRVRNSAKYAENVTIRYTPIDGVKWWLGEVPQSLELHEKTCSHKFRVSGDGFYQVNPEMGDLLVKEVCEEYLKGASDAPHILDLYCGVGVFGLCCMKALESSAIMPGTGNMAPRLVGIESVKPAIENAKKNAAALGVKANFFCERVGGSLPRIKCGPHHTVIVDPPRGGLEKNVPPWLARLPAQRIFYVSCDPATLVRDLSVITRSYEIERVKMFDMFPRTARFETLVVLRRKNKETF